MTDATTTQLAKTAVNHAASGLRQYIYTNKIEIADDQWKPLTDVLKSHVKSRLGEALDDAKDAFDANMNYVGVETFRAAMYLAGVAAGKEYFGNPEN